MANSLRAKLSKLRHDGHITNIEYQEFLKKMDGHDQEIRNKAINDVLEKLSEYDFVLCVIPAADLQGIIYVIEQMKGGA